LQKIVGFHAEIVDVRCLAHMLIFANAGKCIYFAGKDGGLIGPVDQLNVEDRHF